MITDAFRGLYLISQHPAIDSNKIGIMGWSLGGSTAFYSAWEPIIKALTQGDEKFSAHLPLYPGAHIKPNINEWSDAPMHILCGRDDDYTPTKLVEKILEYIICHFVSHLKELLLKQTTVVVMEEIFLRD